MKSVTHGLNRFIGARELEKKIDDLKKEYEQVCAENIALKAFSHYKEETKELYSFNKRYLLEHGHVGQILARHFSLNNQFFLVDLGSSQGIEKDMVALYGNAIIGKVVQVYPWYCKVCLITDMDCKISVVCLPSVKSSCSVKNRNIALELVKKSASGIHEGINAMTHTVIRYVSHLESVKIGDDVFSSGEGLIFPRGFALGQVIAADKGDLFYTVTVQPMIDFQALRYCTIIAKENI